MLNRSKNMPLSGGSPNRIQSLSGRLNSKHILHGCPQDLGDAPRLSYAAAWFVRTLRIKNLRDVPKAGI